MIPAELRDKISKRLTDEIGNREDVGNFVFTFAALNKNRDVDYAMEELDTSDDPIYKKAIGIVIEEILG